VNLRVLLCVVVGASTGCVAPPCEEDPRAQVGLPELQLLLPGETLLAEEARTTTQLERGWKHRQCEREALWLNPEDPEASLDVWGCGLVDPVSVYFVGDGEVLEVVDSLERCPEPCDGCDSVLAPAGTTQVLETLPGRVDLVLGDRIETAG
jgi:hypothetical protein